ncbi:hypothetical protein CHUAL_011683 [Chamberlinius hualienensis]
MSVFVLIIILLCYFVFVFGDANFTAPKVVSAVLNETFKLNDSSKVIPVVPVVDSGVKLTNTSIDSEETSNKHTKKSVIESASGAGGLFIPPPLPPIPPVVATPSFVLHHPPPSPPIYSVAKYPTTAILPSIYTRVKLGYGTFYFNGRDAELRCTFPYNLKINSNFVWNKVTDSLLHYLDVYRVYERTYGHVSSLYLRDVQPKDFGIYACAVSGNFYHDHPVTFYQEVYFYPPVTYPANNYS